MTGRRTHLYASNLTTNVRAVKVVDLRGGISATAFVRSLKSTILADRCQVENKAKVVACPYVSDGLN